MTATEETFLRVNDYFGSAFRYQTDEAEQLAGQTSGPQVDDDNGLLHVPVYGYPGTDFYIIHITALVSLHISIIVSIGILVYLIFFASKVPHFKRSVGERLVVYLAFCDLIFSGCHSLDHWYMIATKDHPPDPLCIFFGFFVQGLILAQSIVVLFTAVGAMVLVVLEKPVNLGRYDWKLIITAVGVPTIVGIAGVLTPFLGPTGPWCMVDMRQHYGVFVNNVYGMGMVAVFFVNSICYTGVWIKIRRTAKISANLLSDQTKKYQKTARMMMLFVLSYLGQYVLFIIQAFWSFVELPPVELMIAIVATTNLGGVYNALAYTVLRRLGGTSAKEN